jgi:hypothetical protein
MVRAAGVTGLLTIIWVTRRLHAEAWEYFERFDDQQFSFFDCTNFAICRWHQVDFVFGFDRDFVIAGFDLRP